MPRLDLNTLTQWITPLAAERGDDLVAAVVERSGASRAAAARALAQLTELGWLVRSGSARRPHHAPGGLRQVVRSYALHGLREDLPWSRDFAPHFSLPREVLRMVQHAFTELLNNAIDHSEGTSATLSLRQTPTQAQLLVSDDGRGVFDKIQHDFAIEDPTLAMLELAKGKLTSAPARHCGRGLYFSARLADVFDLHANARAYQRRDWGQREWAPARALPRQGTTIYLAILLDTARTLDAVLRDASLDGAGYGFERTSVPLRLLAGGAQALESRALARRVGERLASFARAELDFDGVEEVGHAFADELFRVFAREQPGVELVPRNAAPRVARMIDCVRVAA